MHCSSVRSENRRVLESASVTGFSFFFLVVQLSQNRVQSEDTALCGRNKELLCRFYDCLYHSNALCALCKFDKLI